MKRFHLICPKRYHDKKCFGYWEFGPSDPKCLLPSTGNAIIMKTKNEKLCNKLLFYMPLKGDNHTKKNLFCLGLHKISFGFKIIEHLRFRQDLFKRRQRATECVCVCVMIMLFFSLDLSFLLEERMNRNDKKWEKKKYYTHAIHGSLNYNSGLCE